MGDSVILTERAKPDRSWRFSRHDLLPFAALVRIELIRTLRLKRTVIFLVLFLIVAAGTALTYWPDHQQNWASAGNASRAFLAAMSVVLLGGTALSIPALAGNSVVQERERRTLDMLATTHATPTLFVFAKLINSVGFAAILCLSLAPLLVLPVFLVGVNPGTPFLVVSVVLTASLATASLGVWASLRFRRSAAAVVCSYAFMLILQGVLTFLAVMVLQLLSVRLGNAENAVLYMVITLVPMAALSDSINGYISFPAAIPPLYAAMIIHLCIACIAIGLSIQKARKLWGDTTTLPAPRSRRKRIKTSHAFHQTLNPIMLKDLRFTLGLTGRNGLRIAFYTFLICASATAILLFVKLSNNWNDFSSGLEGWMLLRAAFMPLIVVAFCVPLIHNEKTYRTLDALRSTLLTPTEILKGKLLAMAGVCTAFVLAALAADLPHLVIGFYRGSEGVMLITGAGTLITTMFLALGISMASAVYIKDRNTALAVSMIVLFCFLFGNYWILLNIIDPAILYAIDPLIDTPQWYDDRGVAHWRVKLSPILALFNQIDSVRYNRTHFATWASAMVMYSLISAALIAISFRGYQKRMA